MIGSKAVVTWYYETVANHSLATPSASDSHRYAFGIGTAVLLCTISVQNLIFTNPVGLANPTKQCESTREGRVLGPYFSKKTKKIVLLERNRHGMLRQLAIMMGDGRKAGLPMYSRW